MKIVVLAGGISTEREVSISSGSEICKALRKSGHDAILVDVYFGSPDSKWGASGDAGVHAEAERMKALSADLEKVKSLRKTYFGDGVLELCTQADIVFIGLHGENGENGKLQAALDLYGIKYTGTGTLGSAIAMNKAVSKSLLKASGVPCAKGFILRKNEDTSLSSHDMRCPVVVKPCSGGSSIGVYISNTQEEYEKAVEDAFKYESEIMVEEFIKGREFTVGVIEGKAMPVIEIIPKEGFYDYRNKYEPGATLEVCPAQISDELTLNLQKYAQEGYKALYLEAYGRLDFLTDGRENIYCLEANTIPGMTTTSLIPTAARAMGMDYPAICEEILRASLNKYNDN